MLLINVAFQYIGMHVYVSVIKMLIYVSYIKMHVSFACM